MPDEKDGVGHPGDLGRNRPQRRRVAVEVLEATQADEPPPAFTQGESEVSLEEHYLPRGLNVGLGGDIDSRAHGPSELRDNLLDAAQVRCAELDAPVVTLVPRQWRQL